VVTSTTGQQKFHRLRKRLGEIRESNSSLARLELEKFGQSWKRWLSPPDFGDEEFNRLARSFFRFLVFTVLVCDLLAVPMFLSGKEARATTLILFGLLTAVALVALFLIRRKRIIEAGTLFLSTGWAIITYVVYLLDGGLHSPTVAGYLVIILAAALFLGVKTSIAFTGLSISSILLLFVGDRSGLIQIPEVGYSIEARFAGQFLIILVGVVLIYVAVINIRIALSRARAQEEQLRAKNQELETVLASLEERIDVRTEEISQQKQYYEALVLNNPVAIVTLDLNHRIRSCNPAFESLFGFTRDEAIGRDLDDLITTKGSHNEANQLTRQVACGETIKKSTRRKRKDGRLVDVSISGVPVLVEGCQIGSLALYHDISDRIKSEEHLKHLATHDPLTVLPNRALFYDHLHRALEVSKRNQAHLAVFFLDLDGFKFVNDQFGHIQGDDVLQEVATRFRRVLRGSDLVARLGGDEFAFVCNNIHGAEDAAIIATKILETLTLPFSLGERGVFIHGSLGISLFPEDGDDARILLQFADAAMYRVKRQGKNHYQFYSGNRSPS
jgi:diguanylate cyclase (GGDEF)-like protein/PAS domain S-box-containing protein